MVKKFLLMATLIMSGMFAEDAYERHCVPCHAPLPTSLQRMFMNHLLVYGGEHNFKAALKHYLRYPSKDISVMSDLFIDNFGIKEKSTLSDEELDEAIDIYWSKFKVFNKLK
ncbi:MAG: hypothetical protein QG564_1055 [Campylobacterota bacterium]|nr:hypothetical protein [Campylobacterota bacterium]